MYSSKEKLVIPIFGHLTITIFGMNTEKFQKQLPTFWEIPTKGMYAITMVIAIKSGIGKFI